MLSFSLLFVPSVLDYETLVEKYVNVTLTVTDNGSPQKSGTTTVRIWPQNVNDEPPVLASTNPTV